LTGCFGVVSLFPKQHMLNLNEVKNPDKEREMTNQLTDIVTVDIKLPERKKVTARHAIKIGNHSFSQYIAKRLDKDGIGFKPTESWRESATDCETWIMGEMPTGKVQFLAYCHELGHCKSVQPHTKESYYNMSIGGQWSNARLESEHNAWVWGLKYFRRLGFSLDKEMIDAILWSFEGYFKNAKDKLFAKVLADKFKDKFGIECKVPDPTNFDFGISKFDFGKTYNFTIDEYSRFTNPKREIVQEKPKHWKPWHDLKQKQMKKSWKHCK
jgi:hypothetical protein